MTWHGEPFVAAANREGESEIVDMQGMGENVQFEDKVSSGDSEDSQYSIGRF